MSGALTVENGPATVENGKNHIKKISKQGGDDRHSSNTFCTVDTTHPPCQIHSRSPRTKNPTARPTVDPQRGLFPTARPRCSQRGLQSKVAHSEA